MPEIKMKLMSRTEYEDLNKAINDGTQECFECEKGNLELVGGHDYDYETKVGVRFYVDLHCRYCGSSIRVREQIIDRWGIPLLQIDNDKALQFVDLVHKSWEKEGGD